MGMIMITSRSKMRACVNSMSACGGGDGPEARRAACCYSGQSGFWEGGPAMGLNWCAGTTPILKKTLREWRGKWKSLMWLPINSGNRSGSCSENCGFRIAQVAGCHSENGISYSESCSENTPELSESSENGLFTPRAFFPEIGVVPRLLSFTV